MPPQEELLGPEEQCDVNASEDLDVVCPEINSLVEYTVILFENVSIKIFKGIENRPTEQLQGNML